MAAESGHGVDGLRVEFLQAVEDGVDSMDLRIRLHELGSLAEGVQLLDAGGVGFDVTG
jgi:hypothetical protein